MESMYYNKKNKINLEKLQVVITKVTEYTGAWVAKAYLDSGKYKGYHKTKLRS